MNDIFETENQNQEPQQQANNQKQKADNNWVYVYCFRDEVIAETKTSLLIKPRFLNGYSLWIFKSNYFYNKYSDTPLAQFRIDLNFGWVKIFKDGKEKTIHPGAIISRWENFKQQILTWEEVEIELTDGKITGRTLEQIDHLKNFRALKNKLLDLENYKKNKTPENIEENFNFD